jgi:hypothetical protein
MPREKDADNAAAEAAAHITVLQPPSSTHEMLESFVISLIGHVIKCG